jgi:hypothetical protein
LHNKVIESSDNEELFQGLKIGVKTTTEIAKFA